MTHVHIENESGLVRDTQSRAILVTDYSAAAAWKRKQDRERSQLERIDNLEKEVSDLHSKMDLLIDLVRKQSA